MTALQRLQHKLSESRSAINDLASKPDRSEEEINKLSELRTKHQELEGEYRTALQESPAPESREIDGEDRERRELRDRSNVSEYLKAALERRAVGGAEAEFNAALSMGLEMMPLDVLAPRDTAEQRATTPSPATSSIVRPAPTVPAVFQDGLAAQLGISMPQVGPGTRAYVRVSTAPASGAGFVAKSASADATAGALTVTPQTPRRLSVRLTLTAEDKAVLPSLETDMRRALRDRLNDVLDSQIVTGNGTAPNLSGLFNQATDVAVASTLVTWAAWNGKLVGLVDGTYASSLKDVIGVFGTDTYEKLDSMFLENPGNYSAWDRTQDKLSRAIVSNKVPAKASKAQKALILKTGRPRTIEVPIWQGVQLIVDPYTRSAEGETHLTLLMLAGDPFVPYQTSQVLEIHPKIEA